MSDKNTKIYTHVVLSHKVKEIWSFSGAGWGGAALESLKTSPSQKHIRNVESTVSCLEIICSARLNIITGIDFVLPGQSNSGRLLRSLDRMYVDVSSLGEK